MRRARSARPEVGPRCGNCGSPDVELTRAGWAESLSAWLRFGGPWRPARRVCRRCGQVDTAGSVAWLARPAGWWSLPVRLAGVVRRRRAMVPAPATYLIAAVAGAGLGVVAQLLVGWPWSLVAAGVVAAVWLLFLSSAFWGRAAARPLATEILWRSIPSGDCGGSGRPWSSNSGPPRSPCTVCLPPGPGRATSAGGGATGRGASRGS